MANTSRRTAKPDRFEDHAVTAEEPPREQYSAHQPNLDAEQLGAVSYPKNRPMRDGWDGDARAETRKLLARVKGRRK